MFDLFLTYFEVMRLYVYFYLGSDSEDILFWILRANSGFEDFLIRRPLLTDYDSVSAANVAR